MIVTFELFVFLLHLKISFFEKGYNGRCSNQGCGLGLRTGQFGSVHLARTRTWICQKKITSRRVRRLDLMQYRPFEDFADCYYYLFSDKLLNLE